MLDTLITNKTRLNLLLRFFLHPETASYLRGLEEEFGESTNAIRIELNRFEAAGLLHSWLEKNRKMFSANRDHPLFDDIHRILVKYTGLDSVISTVIAKAGNVEAAFVKGIMSNPSGQAPLDVYIFGDPVDPDYLAALTEKVRGILNREIRCSLLPPAEERIFRQANKDALLIWRKAAPAGDPNATAAENNRE
jgi:hypothetical protein